MFKAKGKEGDLIKSSYLQQIVFVFVVEDNNQQDFAKEKMIQEKKSTYITENTKTSVNMNVESSQSKPGRSNGSHVSGSSNCSNVGPNVQTENMNEKFESDVENLEEAMNSNEQQ